MLTRTKIQMSDATNFTMKQIIYTALVILMTGNIYMFINKSYPLKFFKCHKSDYVECHLQDERILPIANEKNFTSTKQIFFHETSCKAGLDSRQSCAIESAANLNPDYDINVFFVGSLSNLFLSSSVYELLTKRKNVHFYRVIVATYNYKTPMEALMPAEVMFLDRKYCLEHMSDMLRYLSLYKYGGVYLDLDVISVKPLELLPPNWVVKESPITFGAGALGLSKNKVGTDIAERIVRKFSKEFNAVSWSNSSTGILTHVLSETCTTTHVKEMTNKTCPGIAILDSSVFYPVHYSGFLRYFQKGEIDTSESYGVHIWNHMSTGYKAHRSSGLAKLAKKFCPDTYRLYGDTFGLYFQKGEIDTSDSYGVHIWNHMSTGYKAHRNSALAKLAKQFCPETYRLYGDTFGL